MVISALVSSFIVNVTALMQPQGKVMNVLRNK